MNESINHNFISTGQLASPTQQLSLALSWNRVDVAESKIFSDEIVWPVSMHMYSYSY